MRRRPPASCPSANAERVLVPRRSAKRSHEEQPDYRQSDNQTQDAGAAVFVLNHAHEAQDQTERRPQE
jgi:hypothetical protein